MTDIASLNIKIDSSDAKTAKNALDKMTSSGKNAESQMGSMSNAALKLGKALAAAFVSYKIAQFTKDVVMAAARYETLGVVMLKVGENAGYTASQVTSFSNQIRESGIQMDTARQVTIRMIQAQIDMSQASKLARVAQDAAVIGNINSSEALERMLHGIQSAETEIMKGIGLNVSFEKSYKTLATQLGVNKDSLTEQQKMQARVNETMEVAKAIAGSYEASMTTAGKQINSFTRYVGDFKVEMGQAFNPSTGKVVAELTDLMKALSKTISSKEAQEGLEDIAEALAGMTISASSFIKEGLPGHISTLGTAVSTVVSIYNSIPSELTGPAGAGIVGAVLFGGNIGKIIATIAAVNNGMSAMGNGIGDLVAKHKASGEAIIKLWNSITDAVSGSASKSTVISKDFSSVFAEHFKKAETATTAIVTASTAANTSAKKKGLTDQEKALKKSLEEQKRANESFDDDYKKATLSTFGYEISKLDEKYEYFKSQKVDEVRLEEWYAEEHFRINQEDIARYYDAQEQKIAAQKKIQEEQLKLEQEAADEAKRISDEAAEAQQDAYDELNDGIYGFTREVIDDVDNMGDTLVHMAEDMVKDIIAAFVTQKIAIPIYMYAADMAGISTGLSSGMSPSSGGLASMTSPISSLFTIGKTAYTLVTEGVSAAVSDLVGADLLGSISSAMFGETAATAAAMEFTTISPTVASTIESAYAVANGGAATTTSAASGLGAATAAGLAVAAFMAIDTFLGSHDEADPDLYVQSPTGGLTESTAAYSVPNRDAVTDEIVTIFDAAFASLDESLDANIVDAVTASAFRGKIRVTDLDETDPNALINALVESAFSGNYTGSIASFEGLFGQGGMTNKSVKSDGEYMDYWNNMVTGFTKGLDGNYSKGLSDILMEAIGLDSGIFDFDFLKSLQAEGQNIFDTFANFAIVVQETDGFVENITRQMNEFGFTVEEAFANILVVISVLDEMQASADALTTVTAITTLKQLTESWYALIDSLEAAYATTSQISESESTMATVLGASISGLTADALQSALSSGGDIDSIIKTAIETSAYADIAQKIAEEYVSGINNQIGQVWLDTDGNLQAVVEAMQNIDTTEAQKAIAELRESFGLLSDTAEDQANDIAEYNELLAAAAAKRRELSIDILYAQGEAEQALAMEREDIINELIETYGSESDTIIDLQEQLWALNDAAESTTEVLEDLLSVVEDARSNYENALNTALSAAKSEYDTLVESFKSAEDQLNTVRAAHIEEQKTLLQEQTEAYSDSIADLTDELAELESIAENLREYREGLLLGEDSPLLPGEMLAEAQAQFAVAGPENIVYASQNLLSAGQEAITDYKEYAKLFAMVQSGVSGAESDVKTQSQALQEQIDMASVQVDLLNAEIELMAETSETLMSIEQAEAEYYAAKLELDNSSFAEDIAFYEKELDRLDRINGSVISLDQATQNYQSALIAAISQGYNNLEYNFQAELNELEDTLGVGASFAGGGIISGPASGYNVVTQFHGTEMIIPESKFDSIKSDKESDEEIKSLLRTLISKVSEDSQHNKKIHRILDRADAGQGSLLVRTT